MWFEVLLTLDALPYEVGLDFPLRPGTCKPQALPIRRPFQPHETGVFFLALDGAFGSDGRGASEPNSALFALSTSPELLLPVQDWRKP